MTEPPASIVEPRPDLVGRSGGGRAPMGVRLMLPGRVWAAAGDGPLALALTVNGRACGAPLSIARGEMVRAFEMTLGRNGAEDDARSALLCLEHVAEGGFWSALSDGARAVLGRIADQYGLQELLPEGVARLPELPQMPLDVALAEEAFLAMVAQHRAAGDRDVADLLDRVPALPPEARRELYLMLTDLFCAEGAFGALHARAASEGLAEMGEGGDPWHRSLRLPWLMAESAMERVELLLRRITGEAGAWISMASVCWTARQAVESLQPSLAIARREVLVEGFLDFLDVHAGSYWGRATGRQMIEAAIGLLAAGGRLRQELARRVVASVLKAQGLSPGFWQAYDAALAEGRLVAEPVLMAARGGFAAIAAQARGEPVAAEELEAALGLFAEAGNREAARFRRELLGPLGQAGTAEDGGALARGLMARGEDPGPAVLRAMAFPSEPPLVGAEAAAELGPLVRGAVSEAHDLVGHGLHHGLQVDLSLRIAALLDKPGAVTGAVLDALFRDLAALALTSDRGLGLALGIALFDALLRAGREAEARAVMGRVEALRAALPGDAGGSLAVQSALAAVSARAGDHPLALWLSESLPPRGGGLSLPADADEGVETPPLHDLLVIVVSCRPYLDSRIPAMRAAWLDRLEAFGVPWVVAVGGSEGAARRAGHVLHLDAPDDYEGLPQKVLAAFGWALEHTRAGHVLKIDDDCFLDVEAFLEAQSWRKFAYYGRKLTRLHGQTDRRWHQAKSTSERGRREVDKSPEPSTYCDGGSGYVLARVALSALKERMATGVGQLLAQVSFMEDKLVGDLLASAGIRAEDEDHLVAILRRSAGEAKPVSVWSNSFLPSAASGVKLVHLDSREGQAEAAAVKDRPVLWPKKVWPGYSAPTLIYNANVLELVSPVARLQAVNAADVAVVAVVRNEMFMLPHFLAHYRAMGVESFLIADNLSDDGTLDYLLEQPDVATFSVDSDYRVSHYGVAWQQALMSNFRVNRWSLVADADELLVTGAGVEPLAAMLAGADFDGADAARIFMLDLYPRGRCRTRGSRRAGLSTRPVSATASRF